jgi:Recombinase
MELPANAIRGTRLAWKVPTLALVREILVNPFYAGAYVCGRRPMETVLVDGHLKKRQTALRPAESCRVFIRDHHEGYIDWTIYEENQRILRRNSVNWQGDETMAAIRAGQGLIAVSGTLYRLFGRAQEPEAFPILSLFGGIAMSTIGQRMLRLDEGRALLRYRLLPKGGWKLLVTQDMTFLIPLAIMVSLLSLRTGIAFGLVAIAVGRYPSLRQRADQRRWRFRGRRSTFGVAQVILGGFAGIGAARAGLWVIAVAFALYVASIFWGELLWRRPDCLVEKHVHDRAVHAATSDGNVREAGLCLLVAGAVESRLCLTRNKRFENSTARISPRKRPLLEVSL